MVWRVDRHGGVLTIITVFVDIEGPEPTVGQYRVWDRKGAHYGVLTVHSCKQTCLEAVGGAEEVQQQGRS